MKNRVKFITGWNAGQRHANLAITPPDFTFDDKTPDFLAGYGFGWADRKAGKVADERAAANCIGEAWQTYQSGGDIPKVKLPERAGKIVLADAMPGGA
jgi:hypothetical protein